MAGTISGHILLSILVATLLLMIEANQSKNPQDESELIASHKTTNVRILRQKLEQLLESEEISENDINALDERHGKHEPSGPDSKGPKSKGPKSSESCSSESKGPKSRGSKSSESCSSESKGPKSKEPKSSESCSSESKGPKSKESKCSKSSSSESSSSSEESEGPKTTAEPGDGSGSSEEDQQTTENSETTDEPGSTEGSGSSEETDKPNTTDEPNTTEVPEASAEESVETQRQQSRCNSSAKKYFTVEGDCHKYVKCINGREVAMRCGTNLYWNPLQEACGRTSRYCGNA